jgi:dolichol-phosphate mannosyltransferase
MVQERVWVDVRISVIVPVYNEEDNIGQLVAELSSVAGRLGECEVILVDDGSSDGTWAHVRDAAAKVPCLRGIHCRRNGGQSRAILVGLHEARGDVVVTLDGDLQNDPADIPRMVDQLAGHDAVCGRRAKRQDTWTKRWGSRLANRVRNWVTRDGIRDTGCSLKAFRRELVGDLPWFQGVHRFMPAYFRLHGRDVVECDVAHRPRTRGQSKYTNFKRLPRTVFDLLGFVWYRSRYLEPLRAEDRETTL